MAEYSLDETDKQLLELLQSDARADAVTLSEEIGVSDNTVHNRMARMEEAGVIDGYTVVVNHDVTELNLTWLFICTARISDRRTVAESILALPGVVDVTELMTGRQNLLVKAVGAEKEDATRLAEQLDNLNVEIDDEILIREEHMTTPHYSEISGIEAE